MSVHCYKCGRFVGKDGYIDIYFDMGTGVHEEGYSECGSCRGKGGAI